MTPVSTTGLNAPRPRVLPPDGLDQIITTFGNIQDYLYNDGTLNPQWQHDILEYVALPVPLMLSFDHSLNITHFRCHKLLVDLFDEVFTELKNQDLQTALSSFGGCYSFGPQRSGNKLSAHSWGIAIDLNPESNQQGTEGNMNPALVAVFQQAGFQWGGDWHGTRKDPMHFQFCSDY